MTPAPQSNCEKVLMAIRQGCTTADAIARKTGLSHVRVGTYITRLRRRYLVEAKDNKRPKTYGLTVPQCALEEVWKWPTSCQTQP
jgi:Sulfolobus plasmid regulatory protein